MSSHARARRPKAEGDAALGKADKGKGCALVATLDGHMVVAYKSGLVEKYTELGRRMWASRVTTQVQPGLLAVMAE